MTTEKLEGEIKEIRETLKEDFSDKVLIAVDGHAFDADKVTDYDGGILIEASPMDDFPIYRYRFTYLMFEPGPNGAYRGITHRTFGCSNDVSIVRNRKDYIPDYEDTRYVMTRIERELDADSDIYKSVWEGSGIDE